MDGRDFGPPRSVHGPPPPLLSGLAMDSHRVGTAAAGRLPASGLPGPLPPGKYMAGLNLHPHPGKCPAPWPPPSGPPGILRREAGGNTTRPAPGRSRQGRGSSLALGGSTGVRAGSAPRAGRPSGPGQRPVPRILRRGCAARLLSPVRGCRPRAHASAEIGATWAIPTPGLLRLQSRLGFFRNLGKKRISSSTLFETSVPRARNLFLANALARRPWAPVPFLASPLAPRGVSGQPRRLRLWGGRRAWPLARGRSPPGSPSARGRRAAVPGRTPRRSAAVPAPGAPCSPAGGRAGGRAARWGAEAGPPPPRS
uniref:translation initiation factor IF-2-like n=1 Tax=Halichoerus grypus TaxID=9711 RepID=UPI0016592249|nr:translation initiation factor IF-2-like [Halichoerus grypus]